MDTLLLILYIVFFSSFIYLVFAKLLTEEKVDASQDFYIEFLRKEGSKAVFVSHQLNQMFFVKLDGYDLAYTEIESKYELNYVPDGWGRHTIKHNNKTYSLYEYEFIAN